jgi:MFS family permease
VEPGPDDGEHPREAGDQPASRWLTPGVKGIGAASLLADAGHEIPTALLPSLLTSTLGAPAAALGVIEGLSDGLAGLARLGGGALADDPHRRRRVAVGGYTTTAVLSAATAGATAPWQVAVLRAGAWTARGLRVPSRNALLADVVPATAYGRAYGFERAMDNLGAIVGPLLALVLVSALGTRWAIALSVVPGLAAAAAIVYAIRHTPRPAERTHEPIRLRIRPVLRGGLGHLMAGVSVFEFGNVAATLLILRATDLLTPGRGVDAATRTAIGLYVTCNLAATLTSVPAGRLGDRTGAVRVLAYGVGASVLAYGIFAAGPGGVGALAVAFVAAGVGIGAVETAEHAAVATRAPEALRGSAFGLLAAVQSAGNLTASALAGLLYTAVSPGWAFGALAGTMLVALVAVVTADRRGPLRAS